MPSDVRWLLNQPFNTLTKLELNRLSMETGDHIESQPSEKTMPDEQDPSLENVSSLDKGQNFWKRIEPTIKIVIFVSVLMLFFFGTFKFYDWRTRVNTQRFLEPFETTDGMIYSRIISINTQEKLTEEEKISTLRTQYKILSGRKGHHRELAEYFVGNYYASIVIVLFASVGCAVFVFVIASRGWARTNSYIKAVFFVLAFMAIFFAIFPNVFGQKGNFENNLEAFLRYDNLQIEIFDYLTTHESVAPLQEGEVFEGRRYPNVDSMISYVNERIILLNSIYYSNGKNRLNHAQTMQESFNKIKNESPSLPSTSQVLDSSTN